VSDARGVVFDVVGLDHRVTRASQKKLAQLVKDHREVECSLKRDPENEYDENAVKVYVDDPNFRAKKVHIGYLRRGTAKVLASGMDAERLTVRHCYLIYIDVEHGWGRVRVSFFKTPGNKPKFKT